MADQRVPIAPLLAAYGVAATVTRPVPENTPIATTAIWVGLPVANAQPYGTDFRAREPRRRLDLVRSAVPTLPRGTTIAAPEIQGGAVKTWRVDGYADDQDDPQVWRALVVLTQ